ncbi:MAG: phosphoribosylformylglycinamidine synthase subunit PurS [Actinobacteria bacterium]|nr:phosphoribosylformylglycinamidine synthase subunit PurS [Actinomycetota bacterium]
MSDATFRIRVTVRLKAGVNDPQGATVQAGLRDLGYRQVDGVRVGKIIEFTLTAADQAAAHAQVDAMCHALLANPVIETFAIDLGTQVEA